MDKRVTVYDIAHELGLSTSTVSRVLNGSSLISDERTKQILEMAERLGYQKRAIKKHSSRVILNIHLFLPASTNGDLLHFFYNISELMCAIQEGFGPIHLSFICRVNDNNLEFLERKKTGQIDACLFAFTLPSAELEAELAQRKIPAVLLNRTATQMPYVCYDIAQGIELLAAAMLRERGAQLRPCYLGFGKLPEVTQLRVAAAQQFFGAHGIPFGPEHVFELAALEDSSQLGVDWVQRNGFNAVLAFNDLVALSFLETALHLGLRFPGDLLLSGFDNSPIQKLLDRRIDTINLSIWELGQVAGAWLKNLIIDRAEGSLQEVLPALYVPGHTIRREPEESKGRGPETRT